MLLLGIDLGSSSIKVAIVDAQSKKLIGVEKYPKTEMSMISHHKGWAEQNPEEWWNYLCIATKELLKKSSIEHSDIKGIGISYQMHGLVLVDKDQNVLRPSIIWCDSRAVEIGKEAFDQIGHEKCLTELMNSPGNFTASKLKWVKDNEPTLFNKIDKIMLPGDFIAMKLTGEVNTTVSGLSEAMLWNFGSNEISNTVLDHYGINKDLIPTIVPNISVQGEVCAKAAQEIGLSKGTIIGYRGGDQPNNALSLGVLNPGEVAATGGTSGVVYGVIDEKNYDSQSRVNNFAHINHSHENPRIGVLLCINGTGIAYNHIKQMMADVETSYERLEQLAQTVNIGSDGLLHFPFGNGAERMLMDKNIGAQYIGIEFNRHSKSHYYRATLEGIAFSFVYGIEIMKKMGLTIGKLIAGNDNLFQSSVFSQTVSSLTNTSIELIETTGAIGAAKASGIACGAYKTLDEACKSGTPLTVFHPESSISELTDVYQSWHSHLSLLTE